MYKMEYHVSIFLCVFGLTLVMNAGESIMNYKGIIKVY